MFVTVKLLDELKACENQRRRFADLFPFGAELSRTVIVRYAQDFNWTWCAENLASPAGLDAYLQSIAPALAAYKQVIDSEEAADQQVLRPASDTYDLACANAFADVMGL